MSGDCLHCSQMDGIYTEWRDNKNNTVCFLQKWNSFKLVRTNNKETKESTKMV